MWKRRGIGPACPETACALDVTSPSWLSAPPFQAGIFAASFGGSRSLSACSRERSHTSPRSVTPSIGLRFECLPPFRRGPRRSPCGCVRCRLETWRRSGDVALAQSKPQSPFRERDARGAPQRIGACSVPLAASPRLRRRMHRTGSTGTKMRRCFCGPRLHNRLLQYDTDARARP